MSKAITFIETSVFTKQFMAMASDDELVELQKRLIANPVAGALIIGTGGLRKIRLAIGNKGKSAGARVIYFIATEEIIYLVYAYPKSIKGNLSSEEKSSLKLLAQQLGEEDQHESL